MCVCVCVWGGGAEEFLLLSKMSVIASTVFYGLIFFNKTYALFTRVSFYLLDC
jgi:hypothetical protein